MTILRQPTRAGVRDAAAKVSAILPPTPLLVQEVRGVAVAFKAESLQPIGAFKIRGAWHRLTALDERVRGQGVVAFSSGNHAQGVAWAAKRLGIPAVIVMPSDASRVKRAATAEYGAEIVTYDRDREDRTAIGRRLADERGLTLIPPFDHPHIIAGAGTANPDSLLAAIRLAARMADEVMVIDRGRIVARGAPHAVLTSGLLRDVYGVEALVTEHAGEPVIVPWAPS